MPRVASGEVAAKKIPSGLRSPRNREPSSPWDGTIEDGTDPSAWTNSKSVSHESGKLKRAKHLNIQNICRGIDSNAIKQHGEICKRESFPCITTRDKTRGELDRNICIPEFHGFVRLLQLALYVGRSFPSDLKWLGKSPHDIALHPARCLLETDGL